MTTPRTHAAILRDVTRQNERVRRAEAALNTELDRRRALYVEARDLDDPISYRALAEASGVTEGAVMQVVAKARKEQVAGTG